MLRKVAAALIAAGALVALHRLVVVPWRCNLVAARASESTDEVWPLRDTARARSVATENLPLLLRCTEQCPTDVRLALLAASNFRLLNRNAVAAVYLVQALRYERRPELFFELGQTQAEMGARDEALANFVKAGTFAGMQILEKISDPDLRNRAYATVGRRQEDLLARQGRLDVRDRQADAAVSAFNGAVLSRDGALTRVLAPRTDSGIQFTLQDPQTVPRARTTAWVLVKRGRVYLGSGSGGTPTRVAHSRTTGTWEKLEGVNETCPVNVTLLAADGPEGAEFLVREVHSRPTLAAPPCGL